MKGRMIPVALLYSSFMWCPSTKVGSDWVIPNEVIAAEKGAQSNIH